MSDTAPTRHAPRALWLIAQAFMQALFTLFGNPEDIAKAPYRNARAYKQLATWIAAGEAMLRRLLMVEAAAAPVAPPLKKRAPRPYQKRAKIECTPDRPEAWPVSFRAIPRGRRRYRFRRSRRRLFPRRIVDSWRLAVRYEALLRAYNNPAPYAARLARQLRAAPQRARVILRPSSAAIATIGRDAHHEMTKAAASIPWGARPDSS